MAIGSASRARMVAEGLRVALDALRANWLRAALAATGVGVGAGVVVTIAALITGLRTEVLDGMESMGPDNFLVMPFDMSEVRVFSDDAPWLDRPQLSEREIRRIQGLDAVSEAIVGYSFGAALRYESDWITGADWSGTSLGWIKYTPGSISAGRNFTAADLDQSRRVVIVSENLADALFGETDPIGKRVRVHAGRRAANERFTVIGVFSPVANVFSEAQPNYAMVPYTTADRRLKARDRWTFINVQVVPKPEASEDAEHQITATLRTMRGLGPGDENNFAIVRSQQMIDFFNDLTRAFFLVMVGLSSVGLLVGGIGVIGIMLISVTERTREIGIRKALGATRTEIMWQFLLEASLLTVLGGVVGLTLGWGLSQIVAAISPLPARIPLWSVFAAMAVSALTGIVFGLLPAMRASKLDPVDALRYE